MKTPSPRPPNTLLGVLMLDTRFPRVPGDAGHPGAFGVPVRHTVVQGASPRRVVREQDPALLRPFVDAARRLVDEGVTALTTSCGFLVQFQRELQASVPVPVWTSSLLKLPELRRPGVVTVDAASLGVAQLRAAGADPATPVEGLAPGCAFQRTLLDDLPDLDTAAAEREVVAAALRLVAREPAIDAVVLECTNMPPYADAVARATGRPVHHLISLVRERLKDLA
ncbi:MAG: aspartate/glutamate racemase family protein [Burkholderiaceae bacterium]